MQRLTISIGQQFLHTEKIKLELFQLEGQEKMKKKFTKAEELEASFDNNEDISDYLDLENASRPGLEIKRVNVDFPVWMISLLDKEAKKLGVTRQSIIKFWISQKLENAS